MNVLGIESNEKRGIEMTSNLDKTKQLRQDVAPFAKSDTAKSIIQIFNTVVPLLILWAIGFALVDINIWGAIAVSLIASGFVVRTFIIFHDCTHGSFFTSKKANDFIGNITGVLTSFPYEKWKREHTIHHATSGNLDKRGIGDINMMTVEEYLSATKGQRAWYRFYRNPFVMFGLGPLFLVLVVGRINRSDAKQKERFNTYFHNFMLLVVWAAIIALLGVKSFFVVYALSLYVAAMLGIWLFYIQHTYEETYFEYDPEWSYVKAAIEGSSYFQLPKALQWITGNIGFHHVHHLAPRVPNYNLEQAHTDIDPLNKGVTTITLFQSFECIRFKLYDPKNHKFVTFKDVAKYDINTRNSASV